jgi:2-C-methyl-D-erythritol 4-phosphate cytidylyltransferase/2-C-methyl-D-erythritol 2,4-cyclodiphosphate synthase
MHVAAIIAAGGLGTRLGTAPPKQFLDLGDGQAMLARSVSTFASCTLVNEIIVALPATDVSIRHDEPSANTPLTFVRGGARRQDSVANAFKRVSDVADIIVIHDAARPFVSVDLIERTVRAAREHGAAIAALAVTDTVKQATPNAGGSRVVRATLAREAIFLAQTPQAFRRDVLTEAMAAASGLAVTDDAMLVERAGFAVHLVDGDPENIKVTTPDDLAKARAQVQSSAPRAPDLRVGIGYDLHRLVEGRTLVLAGLRIPFERGLQGHSDADIVCHAVTDAILGAAGAGDIGRLFPDTDSRWKDADSLGLLQRAMDALRQSGYGIVNVDVTVIAERPKLLPYLDGMRGNLASALGIDPGAVSLKGKTNEGLGEVGRGEAMACHAVALITHGAQKRGSIER